MFSITPVHTLPDRAIRQTLHHPEALQALLKHTLAERAEKLDCSRMTVLEREFATDDWRGREADLLFEVPIRGSSDSLVTAVCVIVEHQSDPDPLMPLRLLLDAVFAWEKQWNEHQKQGRGPLRLRPIIPIVFYTGAKAWRDLKSLRELLGPPEDFHEFTPDFKPIFLNLNHYTPAELLASEDFWWNTLAIIRAEQRPREEFAEVFTGVLGKLNRISSKRELFWYDLNWMVESWKSRRPPEERTSLTELFRKTVRKPSRKAKGAEMAKTIADALIEEGLEQGLEQGLLRERRRCIQSAATKRFGTPPGEELAELARTTDMLRLERIWDGVFEVSSWTELLAIQ